MGARAWVSYGLTLPHSLYLSPKQIFVILETIPQSLSPSPVRHSFCNFDRPFHNHSLCSVSVISTSLKPFLKSSSLFGRSALPTSSFHHSLLFLLCPPTRLMPHTLLVHSITISLNFSHSFSTLSTSPPLHTSYFPSKLSWYALSTRYLQGTK